MYRPQIYFYDNSKINMLGMVIERLLDQGVNASCSSGCCSKEGECISFENDPWEKCLIENGCQSEFGYCTTVEKSNEECEKEVKENKQCQIEFKNIIIKNEILSKGETFKSDKCQTFYKRQFANQSVCSIAKKYNSFGFIDNYNKTAYLNLNSRYNNVRLNNILGNYTGCHQKDILDNITEEELEKKCEIVYSNKCNELNNIINEESAKYSVLTGIILENYNNNRKKCSKGVRYPCCLKTKEVVTTDESGNWGYENDDFCFICWSFSLGYPCCMETIAIAQIDENGQWGVEDGHWCGIVN
ncbi:hypothetical protein LY90DRAFT_517565 [Neocallimastix californiae]|uniref:CBM10 domain-containing protein n=1 Tax=Neocallimastix californiae TaxID=1754190 RepID=A0A1Y2A5C2_9FUNG|nr:hypothetical protein LY90DRAFT_517565 [Neocallimastix californiae]|eukprot:ORY17706.1 hypothetical protein LY90DRAFT_517565 [Neocallimastix californiae]